MSHKRVLLTSLATVIMFGMLAGLRTSLPWAWVPSAATKSALSDQQVGELQAAVFRNRDVFGGLWGDPIGHVVTVSVAHPASESRMSDAMNELATVGSSVDPKLLTRPKPWRVQFSSGGPSLATLDNVLAQVTTVEPWASEAKASLVRWGIDPTVHAVVIGLTSITPKLTADANRAFGGLARLTIERRPILQDRSIDSQPYYSSDRIAYSLATPPCTSGFAAYDPNASSHRGVLAAGHCYALNAVVVQGFFDNNNVLHKSGNIGKVTRYSRGANLVDAEFIDSAVTGTSISDFVWRGPNPPTGVTKPSGTGVPFPGQHVCLDGAITAETCHGVLSSRTNFCDYVDRIITCGLYEVTSDNGSILAHQGDSGGPVFNNDGFGGLTAYGLIEAAAGDQTGTTEWYTDITAALNTLHVVLIVN
jgi:hypothetical protein